ncbi:MAG: hypothetical protein Q9187_008100 [Circinaria calcarea]
MKLLHESSLGRANGSDTVWQRRGNQDLRYSQQDTLLPASRTSSQPNIRSLAESSMISLAATLTSELPRSPTSPLRNAFAPRSRVDSWSIETDDAPPTVHALKYSGAGRFWKPPDESNSRGGPLRAWRKWSGRRDINERADPRYASFPTQAIAKERESAERKSPAQQQFPYSQPIDKDRRASSSTPGEHTTRLSFPTSPSDSQINSEPGDKESVDSLQQRIDSLAKTIAANERRVRTEQYLRKLQSDEDERIAQLETDELPGGVDLSSDLSRNTSDASHRSQVNEPKTPETSARSLLGGDFMFKVGEKLQSLDTRTSSHWDEPRKKPDSIKTEVKEPEPSIPELPSNPVILLPEIDSNSDANPTMEDDSIFSDLDRFVGVLRSKAQTSQASCQRSRPPSYTSQRDSGYNTWPPPQNKPYPSAIELSAPSPAASPPTNVFELSTSNSVIHRPSVRRQALARPNRRSRHHSDLTLYNTLPHEPFPVCEPEVMVELPTEGGKLRRKEVSSKGPRIDIEPEIDPRTGKPWVPKG